MPVDVVADLHCLVSVRIVGVGGICVVVAVVIAISVAVVVVCANAVVEVLSVDVAAEETTLPESVGAEGVAEAGDVDEVDAAAAGRSIENRSVVKEFPISLPLCGSISSTLRKYWVLSFPLASPTRWRRFQPAWKEKKFSFG